MMVSELTEWLGLIEGGMNVFEDIDLYKLSSSN
jgi:hypothetical protein